MSQIIVKSDQKIWVQEVWVFLLHFMTILKVFFKSKKSSVHNMTFIRKTFYFFQLDNSLQSL